MHSGKQLLFHLLSHIVDSILSPVYIRSESQIQQILGFFSMIPCLCSVSVLCHPLIYMTLDFNCGRTVVLLAPGVQAIGGTHRDGNVEGLASDTAEGVEDSLMQGAGKGTLLKGRESVDGNTALLRGAQMSPPTHPFSYCVSLVQFVLIQYFSDWVVLVS